MHLVIYQFKTLKYIAVIVPHSRYSFIFTYVFAFSGVLPSLFNLHASLWRSRLTNFFWYRPSGNNFSPFLSEKKGVYFILIFEVYFHWLQNASLTIFLHYAEDAIPLPSDFHGLSHKVICKTHWCFFESNAFLLLNLRLSLHINFAAVLIWDCRYCFPCVILLNSVD